MFRSRLTLLASHRSPPFRRSFLSFLAVALTLPATALELPTYAFASGTSGIVVGQAFALPPAPLEGGTQERYGFWHGTIRPSGPVSIHKVAPPAASADWLRLDRNRLDFETLGPTKRPFLSEVPAASCAEEPSCVGLAVRLEKPLELELAVYDLLGVPVGTWSRHVTRQEIALRRQGASEAWLELGWNGRSAEGRAVTSGIYLIRVLKSFENGERAEQILKVGLRTH